jgi:hypothetical protein
VALNPETQAVAKAGSLEPIAGETIGRWPTHDYKNC